MRGYANSGPLIMAEINTTTAQMNGRDAHIAKPPQRFHRSVYIVYICLECSRIVLCYDASAWPTMIRESLNFTPPSELIAEVIWIRVYVSNIVNVAGFGVNNGWFWFFSCSSRFRWGYVAGFDKISLWIFEVMSYSFCGMCTVMWWGFLFFSSLQRFFSSIKVMLKDLKIKLHT